MDTIPLRRAKTSLGALLASTLQSQQQQAGSAEIGLHLDVAKGVPDVDVDPEKIAWAVTALVGNAMRYARRGSRRLPGGSIVVKVEAEGDDVVIRVIDDGPGIPADKLPWLFARKPGASHAAGISLLLVQDVVAAHGGTVDVVSRTDVEHGTEVTLRLPLRGPGSTSAPAA